MKEVLIDMGTTFPLLINYWPGTTGTLVVVFSGVGTDPDETPQIEFFRSATADKTHHALFVSDASRSWLNWPDIDNQIVDTIEKVMHQHGLQRLSLVGNSMGGTMALLLAKRTRAQSVLALVPQFSVSPEVVPEEKRWRRYRRKIQHFKFRETIPENMPGQNIFIVHGGTSGEMIHASRFPLVRGVRHFVLPRYGHSLAKKLNKKKLLRPIVSAAIDGRPVKFRRLIEQQGGVFMKNFEAEPEQQGTGRRF